MTHNMDLVKDEVVLSFDRYTATILRLYSAFITDSLPEIHESII